MPQLSMQLKDLSMGQNHLSGALPSSWGGLIQASLASKSGSKWPVGVCMAQAISNVHNTDWQTHDLLTSIHAIAHTRQCVAW